MQETTSKLSVLLSIGVVILAAGLLASVIKTTPEQKSLSVSGSASAFVIPDTASISIGVITQAATAKEALENNTAKINDVINSLKAIGVQEKDIRTSLSIQPLYKYKEGEAPTIIGYQASNNLEVTTKLLDKLGDIVDSSVASGANQVSGVSFTVSEEKQKQIRNELLANAVKDAEYSANKLAESLKVKIIGVRTSSTFISEGIFPIAIPIAEKAAAPIFPGANKVTLSVQVEYIIE